VTLSVHENFVLHSIVCDADWHAVDPGFYSMNLMMIGKTCMRMKDNSRAIEYLTKTRDYPVLTEDDKKVLTLLMLVSLQHCAK